MRKTRRKRRIKKHSRKMRGGVNPFTRLGKALFGFGKGTVNKAKDGVNKGINTMTGTIARATPGATALAAAAKMRSKGKTCEQRRKRTIARAESKQQTAKCRKGRGRKSRIIGGLPAEAKTKVESKGQTAKAAHTEG